MAPIRIQHVVSFSSQDPKNRVENMCDHTGNSRPWLCGKLERNGVLKAELQLERASNICFIDVGNFGSAFIQVDVGRSSWPSEHPYVTLLPAAALMSPADSRQGKGRQSVRMFKKANFLSQAAEDSWDRLRVTCIQPFNKHCQFGLSFLRLRTAEEHTTDEVSALEEDTENHGTPEQRQSVREWLSSPSVKHTFFGQTTGQGSLGEDPRNNGSLTRAERMITAARSTRHSLHIDPHNTLTIQRETENQSTQLVEHSSGFISSGNESTSPQELRGKSKTRQEQERMMTTPKRTRFASSKNLSTKYIRSSTSPRAGTKNSSTLKHSPVKSNTTGMSPKQYLPDSPEHPESVCPLCGVYFSPDYLPLHASSCLDSGSLRFSGSMGTDSMASLPSHSPFSRDDFMLPCPLCSLRFPKYCIEQHASSCGDTIWVD